MHSTSMHDVRKHLHGQSLRETYLQGEVSVVHPNVPPPSEGHDFHVYCSEQNKGASALIHELESATPGLTLLQTSDFSRVADCDCMLVYLTARTWTQGESSAAFATELQQATEANVRLLLAHESKRPPHMQAV